MDISIKQIRELIRQGEGISVEFKTCWNKINRDVYETVCAFLNRHGGTILLGVQDDGTLQGIEPDAVTQLKRDFVTSDNNPLKLTLPTYLSVDVIELDGKSLLRIYCAGKLAGSSLQWPH
jgi:ATP-dependent DNA helicase RecG